MLIIYYLNSIFNETDIQNVIQEMIRRLQNIGLKIVILTNILYIVTNIGKNYQDIIKRNLVILEDPYF